MKYVSKSLLIVVSLIAVSASSCATTGHTHSPGQSGAVYENCDPSMQNASHAQEQGVFARLWELEKRKNAAILRFLGLRD